MDNTEELQQELDRILAMLDKIGARMEGINNQLRQVTEQMEAEVKRWASQN